eukprot:7385120-Prymnesium_polylepis.1
MSPHVRPRGLRTYTYVWMFGRSPDRLLRSHCLCVLAVALPGPAQRGAPLPRVPSPESGNFKIKYGCTVYKFRAGRCARGRRTRAAAPRRVHAQRGRAASLGGSDL